MVDFDDSTALLIIDAQDGIDVPGHGGSARNNPQAEQNIKRLLDAWRGAGRPCVYAVHDSVEPGSPLKLSLPTGRIKPGLEPRDDDLSARINTYDLAFKMQTEAPHVFDLSGESRETLDLYGIGTEPTNEYGRRCLLARRLV